MKKSEIGQTLFAVALLALTIVATAQPKPKAKPPAPTAATTPQAAPAPPPTDYSNARRNLQHQLDDVTRDIQIDSMALQNLQEFQDYLAKNQQGRQLQQQLQNLDQQEAQQKAAAAAQQKQAAPSPPPPSQ